MMEEDKPEAKYGDKISLDKPGGVKPGQTQAECLYVCALFQLTSLPLVFVSVPLLCPLSPPNYPPDSHLCVIVSTSPSVLSLMPPTVSPSL